LQAFRTIAQTIAHPLSASNPAARIIGLKVGGEDRIGGIRLLRARPQARLVRQSDWTFAARRAFMRDEPSGRALAKGAAALAGEEGREKGRSQ
jgi:hypothetical protein